MPADTSTGRSPIRSILTTTSRWPGWTTRSRTCRSNSGVTRESSANCSAPPRRATNRWPANCSANWTICATISTARSTPPATRCAASRVLPLSARAPTSGASSRLAWHCWPLRRCLALLSPPSSPLGLVRPVRRLLLGTAAVEHGALDTVVPVTSRDEIGSLTQSFNSMVGELRVKARIRDTFGKYVDPRIVAGLLDRPELTEAKGSRREMTIFFCDMKGFTALSEGMTPAALVNVLNRYITVMSEPVRRNNGIIDKYIGDGTMAFWGPPFTGTDDHSGPACL